MDSLFRAKRLVAEHHNIIVIGAGQGGLGVSYYLTKAGVKHLVLERGDIANSWKDNRWDTFCLVTPNWTLNLPGKPYRGSDPNGFMKRDEFVQYFTKWAEDFDAPVRKNTNVIRVIPQKSGFLLKTSDGDLTSDIIVVATATYQKPKVPEISKKLPCRITQIHAEQYKNASQINDGEILVVGSGQTGCQVADDLLQAGKAIHLCVGKSGRLPRSYRGRDCISWQKDLKLLERTPDMLDDPAHRFRGDPHLSGRDGGKTLSIHKFNREGVKLYGRLIDVRGDELIFGDSLRADIKFSDDFADDFRKGIDNHILKNSLSAPAPSFKDLDGDLIPDDPFIPEVRKVNLVAKNIKTIIWATGFKYDFSWIEADITDSMGYPITKMGATSLKGLFFNGLNWMTKRKSGILYGFDEDSKKVSEEIIAFSKVNNKTIAFVNS